MAQNIVVYMYFFVSLQRESEDKGSKSSFRNLAYDEKITSGDINKEVLMNHYKHQGL